MIDTNYLPAIAAPEPKNRYPTLVMPELAFGMRVALSDPDPMGR
jgi:hypothetical protein